MKIFVRSLLFSFVLACGGGSSSKPDTTTAADPVPMQEAPTQPATPAEPTETAQPAEPAAPEPPAKDPVVELLAAESAAYANAKPVFEKWCASCHTKGGKKASAKKLEELDMSTYPFTGEHASAEDIREVLGLTGKKPSMPADKKGAVKGDELQAIKAWSEAWDEAHKGGAHAGHAGH